MNIFELCDALNISKDYQDRYNYIILPLLEGGVILFDGSLNPYVDKDDDSHLFTTLDLPRYFYIGQARQNAKLARNIIKNRHLFKDGKLLPNAAAQWQIVD